MSDDAKQPVASNDTDTEQDTTQTASEGAADVDPRETPEFKAALQEEIERVFAERLGRERRKMEKSFREEMETKLKSAQAEVSEKTNQTKQEAPRKSEPPAAKESESELAAMKKQIEQLAEMFTAKQESDTRSAFERAYESVGIDPALKDAIFAAYDNASPRDAEKWLREKYGKFAATAEEQPKGKEAATVKKPGSSDAGAPAAPVDYSGTVNALELTRDEIARLQEQRVQDKTSPLYGKSKLIEVAEKFRRSLPGSGSAVFAPKI